MWISAPEQPNWLDEFSPLISGMVDNPFFVVAILCTLVLAIIVRGPFRKKRRGRGRVIPFGRRASSGAARQDSDNNQVQYPDLRDPKIQMDYVARSDFATRPLMNKEEYKVFNELERLIAEIGDGYRVMAQTSLGEVLTARSKDRRIQSGAFASINSKRLDIAIIDRAGRLVVAIEYQGGGHHQGNAFMRDAVKREALRKAGIPMIEILPTDGPTLLRDRVVQHLTPQRATA